jgi:hypothetical protein
MGWANKLIGWASNNGVEVTSTNRLKIDLADAVSAPEEVGAVRSFCENDAGQSLGVPTLLSPEVDLDYRQRQGGDLLLDDEQFCRTTQNFTKMAMYATTYVPSHTIQGWSSNPTNILTAGAAVLYKTWKPFAMEGTQTLAFDVEGAFSYASGSVMASGQVIEFGWGLTAITTPYESFDAFFIRVSNSGSFGVIRNNSNSDSAVSPIIKSEDGVTDWVPISGRKYQFIPYISPRVCQLWINDPITETVFMAVSMPTPVGFGAPTSGNSAPFFVRQYQVSAPAVAASFNLSRLSARRGGLNTTTTLDSQGARALESAENKVGSLGVTQIQAITSGSITRPAAAVPTNTASTLASLGGIYVETGTLALGTDAILMSYQNPALPVAVGTTIGPNRRLRINGLMIASGVSTAFATGGFSKYFYLAIGSTSVSLAGVAADTVTTKADRRIHIPIIQHYTATHAPGAPNGASMTYFDLPTPEYINPGEFVKLVTYHQGVVGTAGVITHALQLYVTPE